MILFYLQKLPKALHISSVQLLRSCTIKGYYYTQWGMGHHQQHDNDVGGQGQHNESGKEYFQYKLPELLQYAKLVFHHLVLQPLAHPLLEKKDEYKEY